MFIEGFKPGTIQRYGFGYDAVSAKEPGIIYYSISGFGQTGPLAARPAMDPVLQAFIGIVTENKGEHDNHPHRIAISLIDMFSGLLGFQAIATSLYVRREQAVKKGRFIELSLMQGGAMLAVIRMIAHHLEHGVTQRTSMPNGVFNTADGQINITMVRPFHWEPFCEAIEQPQLLDDLRFSSHRRPGAEPGRTVRRAAADHRRPHHGVAVGAADGERHHERAGEQLRGIPAGGAGGGDRDHVLAGPAGRAGADTDAEHSRVAAVRERHEAGACAGTGGAYAGGAGGTWVFGGGDRGALREEDRRRGR